VVAGGGGRGIWWERNGDVCRLKFLLKIRLLVERDCWKRKFHKF
jgi:hypothetical protein